MQAERGWENRVPHPLSDTSPLGWCLRHALLVHSTLYYWINDFILRMHLIWPEKWRKRAWNRWENIIDSKQLNLIFEVPFVSCLSLIKVEVCYRSFNICLFVFSTLSYKVYCQGLNLLMTFCFQFCTVRTLVRLLSHWSLYVKGTKLVLVFPSCILFYD